MKNRNLLTIFFLGFLKSIFAIAVIIIVAAISYKVTISYYETNETLLDNKMPSDVKDIISNAKVETISKNLIFAVDKQTKSIHSIVLELFNTNTNNLDYITIPIQTKYTISDVMYHKICAVNPEVPQIIQLSEMEKYFDEKSIYGYASLIIGELLDTDISYYTIFDFTYYKQIFKTVKKKQKENSIDYKMEQLRQEYIQQCSAFQSESLLKDYIEDLYKQIESNLSLKNKLKYVNYYLNINPDLIYFYSIEGENNTSDFLVDIEKTRELIQTLVQNSTYQTAQKETENIISSKGLNIQILNGSKISGLANTYKQKLTADGFTVTSVGNYEEGTLTNTHIIVKEENRGNDLLQFFNEASIETGELPDGVDIQIILGTQDRLS